MNKRYSVRITKERNWYIARRSEPEVTSQGKTPRAARANLREAVELYLETWGAKTMENGSRTTDN